MRECGRLFNLKGWNTRNTKSLFILKCLRIVDARLPYKSKDAWKLLNLNLSVLLLQALGKDMILDMILNLCLDV